MKPPGELITRHKLPARSSAYLLEQIEAATEAQPGTVINRGSYETFVDKQKRRASVADISVAARAFAESILVNIAPEVSAKYAMRFDGVEAPQFVIYRKGDFFRPHRDSFDRRGEVGRLLTTVLFLNSQTPLPSQGSYCGGELVLYRVGEQLQEIINGESGLLVVFPSEIAHEVRPVTDGVRYAVVGWYIGLHE